MTILSRLVLATAALIMTSNSLTVRAAAEEQTIDAMSVWHAEAHAFRTGENLGTLVGVLKGPFIVQTSEGPVLAGKIVCPGMLDVNTKDGSQTGAGRCVITDEKGAQVFARWTCSGYHLVGCRGDFILTGGTGRFANVTGGGPMVFRIAVADIVASAKRDSAVETSVGIAFWKDLTYTLP